MSDFEHQAPGWYYAEGDSAGTHRYWDGELWHGDPRPIQATAAPAAAPPAPGAPFHALAGGFAPVPASPILLVIGLSASSPPF